MMVASMPSDAHVATGGLGGFVAHGLAARLTTICSGLAFGIAALVLGAHLFGPGYGPLGGPAMKPNTGLCFLLLSAAQYQLLQRKAAQTPRWGVLALAALVLAIAAATLTEHAFDLDFGIDNLLVANRPKPRMSGITGVALLSLAGVTCLTAARLRQVVLCQTLLVVVALCSLLPIMGYLYRAPFLYGAATAVAPGTAVAGLSLTVGFLALRSDEGIWPLLVGDSAGSTLLRRALPAVMFLPAMFGWIRLEAEQHGVGVELGAALIASATALTFVCLLVWSARWLQKEDYLRRAVTDKLREAHATLELRVDERTRELQETEVELRRAAGKLLLAKEAAEGAMRARADFLARMSHEMRTPLNGVVGMLEIVMRSQLTSAQRGYVQTARSSADALLSLISDILDFSKIDAGKLLLEATTFRLRDCIGEALCDSAASAHRKGLELHLYVDSNVPECLVGDRQRLRQVITNLVANAVKFTARGEVRLSVTLQRRTHTEVELAILVADTGVGIAREKQDEIFQAFTQGDETTTRRFGGTGLGLAVSAQLVQLMGGTLTVDSEPDKGARFSFRVELGVDHQAELELDASRAAFAGQRALIVDPQPAHRELVSELLEHWGLEAVSAPFAAAHRKLREAREEGAPFSFLLLDEQAVSSQGESYFENLRAVTGARFPIILTTLATPADSARELRLKYVSAQLTKPIVSSELFETVAGLLMDATAEQATSGEQMQQGALRVLVAEDNEVNRRVACFLLQDAGYQVVAVDDGRKAVAAINQHSFDVVLMDGHMPDMDGLEATREIRQQERGTGRHIPIIALTAQAMKGDRERYFAAGMDGYLTKPFQSAQLYAAIREVLAKNPGSALRAQLIRPQRRVRSAEAPRAAVSSRLGTAVYDRAQLLGRLRGLDGVLRQMVEVFAEEAPQLLTSLRVALDSKEALQVQKAAHKLAGALVTVSANRAGDTARNIEMTARNLDLTHVEDMFAKLSQEMSALHEAFRVEGDLSTTPSVDAGAAQS
jgi:signal transduction histidine kinase/CheY-like chemotaxis protein/HPt (histidine-containing phosphotransfer) domain-containing protein